MAAQAMPVLDQEQLLTGQVITLHCLVMGKRMVARHRYDDWIFRDLHRLDIAKSVRSGHQQDIEFTMVLVAQLPELSAVQQWSLPSGGAHGMDINHGAEILYVACDGGLLV